MELPDRGAGGIRLPRANPDPRRDPEGRGTAGRRRVHGRRQVAHSRCAVGDRYPPDRGRVAGGVTGRPRGGDQDRCRRVRDRGVRLLPLHGLRRPDGDRLRSHRGGDGGPGQSSSDRKGLPLAGGEGDRGFRRVHQVRPRERAGGHLLPHRRHPGDDDPAPRRPRDGGYRGPRRQDRPRRHLRRHLTTCHRLLHEASQGANERPAGDPLPHGLRNGRGQHDPGGRRGGIGTPHYGEWPGGTGRQRPHRGDGPGPVDHVRHRHGDRHEALLRHRPPGGRPVGYPSPATAR